MGVSHHAQAQTAVLDGNSFGYDGLTYTISDCSYTLGGTVDSSGCGAANAQLVGTGTSGGASIEVESATAGQPLMSIASTGGTTSDDLTFYLSISAPSTKTTVNSVTETFVGSANASYPTQVTANVSGTTPTIDLNTNLTSQTATASFDSFNPTVAAPLYLSVNLEVSAANASQGTFTLTNATYTLSPAPEPASIALFGTALAGLAAVRRRQKQPGKQTHTMI